MQHGDLVRVPGRPRLCVALTVSKSDWIKYGVNCERPGLMLFSGFWYEDEAQRVANRHLDFRCYGKIYDPRYSGGIVVGRLTTIWSARKLCS